MSILCQRLERSIAKALLFDASESLQGVDVYDAFTHVNGATVANTMFQAVPDEETFTINFYCGENEETVRTPAIVVQCSTASEDPDAIGNALIDTNIDIMFPAESSSTVDTIATLEAVSVWLWIMIRRYDFHLIVSRQHDDLTACGVDPSGFSSMRVTEGRQRIHRYSCRLYCCGMNLEE